MTENGGTAILCTAINKSPVEVQASGSSMWIQNGICSSDFSANITVVSVVTSNLTK